jgi:hypothetical protein
MDIQSNIDLPATRLEGVPVKRLRFLAHQLSLHLTNQLKFLVFRHPRALSPDFALPLVCFSAHGSNPSCIASAATVARMSSSLRTRNETIASLPSGCSNAITTVGLISPMALAASDCFSAFVKAVTSGRICAPDLHSKRTNPPENSSCPVWIELVTGTARSFFAVLCALPPVRFDARPQQRLQPLLAHPRTCWTPSEKGLAGTP